jgi:hypothetical protein
MILAGSKAMREWFPHFKREPKDTDWIVYEKRTSLLSAGMDCLVNPVICEYYKNKITKTTSNGYAILLPSDLLTLKVSHIFWDIKWDKHMFDIQFLLKEGCAINMELFQKLYTYWNEYHGKNHRSDLDMSAKDFFDNAMKKYDHDYLHTLINPNPTYKKVLKNGKEVDVDEQKFILLSHEEKLSLIREEVYVMAYERLADRNWRPAYAWMLKKFIMHHAPMFEALFIIENYIELHKPTINFKKLLDHELSRNSRSLESTLH